MTKDRRRWFRATRCRGCGAKVKYLWAHIESCKDCVLKEALQ